MRIVYVNVLLSVVAIFFALSGCKSRAGKPLTEAECKFVASREAEYAADKFARFPEMQKLFLNLAMSRAKQCSAGGEFDRADYECLLAAKGADATKLCLEDAASKSRGHRG
jgi:hypothetical protein